MGAGEVVETATISGAANLTSAGVPSSYGQPSGSSRAP